MPSERLCRAHGEPGPLSHTSQRCSGRSGSLAKTALVHVHPGAASGAIGSAVGQIWSNLTRPAKKKVAKQIKKAEARATKAMGMHDEVVEATVKRRTSRYKPPDLYFVARGLFSDFVAFLLLNFIGAGIFCVLERENSWHIVDGFYHSIVRRMSPSNCAPDMPLETTIRASNPPRHATGHGRR